MGDNVRNQMDAIRRYAHLIEKQTGKAVRPYRMDGYVNLMNRYGTAKDPAEHYQFQREPDVPDDTLTTIYEGNGLFAKIIDTPAEEAIKHGFTLKDVSDKAVEDFVAESLDELDWEELAMTAIRWTRLFGGAIAVMLINDGGRLEDPLNWRNIKSIDDIRVYERVVVHPEYESMFNYDPTDPFSTRGSRLGMPEFYQVNSRYGNFRVHDSRCLVFQNGVLPENATNSLYQLWGIPEYIRIHRALKDAELAHESAPKLLDRSVQAIYKMRDLSQLLATEQGESQVLRRLQVIDMARGMLNSLVIDAEGEDYDFKTFQFNGITDVVSASCNMLSAITSIPQTILFGQGVGGMSSTDDTSMENYYNYVERIQKRMLRKNLRYLLSIIFQAGLYTGEVDEVPKLNVEFNPLWSLSDADQAALEQQKASTQLTKAQAAQAYVAMEAIDPSEVRKKLADSDEFDVETMLDELDEDDEDLFSAMSELEGEAGSQNPVEQNTAEKTADYAEGTSVGEHETDPGKNGSASPASAPAATKLPQDMSEEEKVKAQKADSAREDTDWITINGTHVPLDDDGNVESGGPKNLQGKNFKGAKSEKTGESKKTKEKSATKKLSEMSSEEKRIEKEKKLDEIDEDRRQKQAAIMKKYGNKVKKTAEIQNDASLTASQKSQKLAELDKEFQKEWDELGQVAREAKAERERVEAEYGDDAVQNEGKTSAEDRISRERMESSYQKFRSKSKGEIDDERRNQTGEVWSKSSEATKDALYEYTGDAFVAINEALRGESAPDNTTSEQIRNITSAIGKSKLKEDAWFVRRVTPDALEKMLGVSIGSLTPDNAKELVGKEGVDKAFLSCGSSINTEFSGAVKLQIFAPAGTEALYAEPFSANGDGKGRYWDGKSDQKYVSDELETILQRGSRFVCTDAQCSSGWSEDDDDSITITLALVDQEYENP